MPSIHPDQISTRFRKLAGHAAILNQRTLAYAASIVSIMVLSINVKEGVHHRC